VDTIKEKYLECLEQYKGIVTDSCKAANVPRSTYYKWYNTDEEFKQAVDEIQDVAIDWVESKLFEKIEGVTGSKGFDDEGNEITYTIPPSDTAILFYLKCKAKKRGYIESQNLNLNGDLTVKTITGMQIK
jgi:hypothetical protein